MMEWALLYILLAHGEPQAQLIDWYPSESGCEEARMKQQGYANMAFVCAALPHFTVK